MLKRIIKRSPCKFYESIRNRFNTNCVLREGDYVYDIEDGSEWLLLENPNVGGSAKSICTFAPNGCVYKIGTPFKRCYFDEFGKLREYLKRGMNPERNFN
jgi:hypothetical protein